MHFLLRISILIIFSCETCFGQQTEFIKGKGNNDSLIVIDNILTLNLYSGQTQVKTGKEYKDSVIIARLVALDRQNPKEVERFFSGGAETGKQNLGFGWTQAHIGLTGICVHFMATFYYYHGSIISYTILPELPDDNIIQMPDNTPLQNRYIKWYSPYYTTDTVVVMLTKTTWGKKVVIKPFKFNEDGILHPLKEYRFVGGKDNVSQNILAYMSPESGLIYGWRSRFGILENRKGFQSLGDTLPDNEIKAILFSINPASRLTAIEYCIRNKSVLLNNPDIKNWIDTVYKEVPQMPIIMGFESTTLGSKESVEYFLKYIKANAATQ